MRSRTLALAGSLLLLAATYPAQATTSVQDITGLHQNMGDFVPFDINALPFNPSLGVLQDVSVELIGTYTPQIDVYVYTTPPATTNLTTNLFVEVPGSSIFPVTSVPLGSQTVPAVEQSDNEVFLVGSATAVDHTFDLSSAGFAAFETGATTPQDLIQYGFLTGYSFPPGIADGGSTSDLTTFTGSAILTYTYASAVPEPATVLLFAAGLVGLALSRRRSV